MCVHAHVFKNKRMDTSAHMKQVYICTLLAVWPSTDIVQPLAATTRSLLISPVEGGFEKQQL